VKVFCRAWEAQRGVMAVRVVSKKDVEKRVEDDGAGLLYDVETNKTYVLNSTGVWLWDSLAPGLTLEQLLIKARTEFSIDPGCMCEVAEQVADCLLGLYAEKLVSVGVGGRVLP